MNFVFVSLQPLNAGRESTSTCLARELSRFHKVLYVNPPPDRRTLLFGKKKVNPKPHNQRIKQKKPELVEISENFWMLQPSVVLESINWIPFTSIFSRLNHINNKRFATEIHLAIKKLGLDDFILVNDKEIFRGYYLKELLQPMKYIYLHRDNTVAMKYWRRHGRKLEPLLMQKADAVMCNSPEFAEYTRQINPSSFNIGNGYDACRYNSDITYQEPEEFSSIPHPRILYVGALLSLRLDLPLMEKLVTAKPEWSFIFIGKEDDDFRQSSLHQLPNAFFLGVKDTSDVPRYMAHADVCINPQLVNEITDGNFPLKALEYLAMGKPLVATATSTMKNIFGRHVRLATDIQSYKNQLAAALQHDTTQGNAERIAFVQQFSWDKIADKFLNCVGVPIYNL